jgi:hypothetical protein
VFKGIDIIESAENKMWIEFALFYSFRKKISISFATFLPEAMAFTTRVAPLTESPAANTFCLFVDCF